MSRRRWRHEGGRCAYLLPGGAAVLAAQALPEVLTHWEDLGMREAVWHLRARTGGPVVAWTLRDAFKEIDEVERTIILLNRPAPAAPACGGPVMM